MDTELSLVYHIQANLCDLLTSSYEDVDNTITVECNETELFIKLFLSDLAKIAMWRDLI